METYIQKKGEYVLGFELRQEELIYSFKSSVEDSVTPTPYEFIDSNSWNFIEKKDWYRNVGILWIILGSFVAYIQYSYDGKISLPFWVLLGTIFLIIFYAKKINFTVFNSSLGKIYVIKDKQHDEICASIKEYRSKFLKKEFGEIDYSNDLEFEIKKFTHLLKDGVISEEEFSEIKEKLETHHKNKPILSTLY